MRGLVALGFVAVVLTCVAVASSASAQTVSVSPSPVHYGDVLTFSGCGYGANKDVAVVTVDEATESVLYQSFSVRTGTDGCFSLTPSQAPLPVGEYDTYTAYKTGSGVGIYGHHKWLAEFVFSVLP